MPFDRDVTIDFNADISGYSASMGQMIQQTSQYTAAADGMIGKIGKLNNVVMAGVKSMSAFTQTNKVATAQAAAYQQQLSKIETSAAVTGKSFRELEKTTKGLAKDFPIGMKQAVEQVESLQEAGVTTNKEITQLAKTFTKLGAATGTFGPEVGKNMLQLNRTFENGTSSMEKYADSLTTITHQFGANAGAVTSFAKSIAPVAATVGMSETSVLGLSTAFSRLGEDGYAAANTFNKVMLDMSKSIREGTPEAKIYAEVMGTTSESLKAAWEGNPAEGFIDFVEAIKKQGAGGIRSLEQLGLEGVRTQKTIMSLANSGNMREIVEKAQSSYGNGMTGTAAETAMGGVNDQLTMLNETMAQTTATAGKPFLGFLEKVLQVANYISRTISDIVESDFIQKLAKIVGVGGGVFAATKLLNSTAGTLAMLEWGGKKIARANVFQEFREGRGEGLAADTAGRGIGYRAGAALGMYAGPGSGEPFRQALGRNVRNWANMGGNAMALWNRANTSMVLQAMDREGISTPAGERFKSAATQLQNLNTKGMGWTERRALIKKINSELADATKEMMQGEGGIANAARSYAYRTATSASYMARVGGMGMRGLGQVGSALTMGMVGGTTAAALGGAALVGGAGYMLYKGQEQEKEAAERGGKDAYRMFNEFAEKAGIATKGLVSFAEALGESTQKIAAESQSREEAYEFTAKERQQTLQPGYEAAYQTRGNSFWDKLFPSNFNAEKEALRVRGMLGENASPEALNRVQMDLAVEHGEKASTAVMEQLKQWEVQKISSKDLAQMMTEAGSKSRAGGILGTVESSEFIELGQAELARKQKRDIDIQGQNAVQAREYKAAEEGLAKIQYLKVLTGDTQAENTEAFNEFLDSVTLDAEDRSKMIKASRQGKLDLSQGVAQAFRSAGLEGQAAQYETGSQSAAIQAAGGYRSMTEEQIRGLSRSAGEVSAEKQKATMEAAGFTAGTLGVEMANTAKTIRESGMTIEEWKEAVDKGTASATDMEKAWADLELQPGDVNAQSRMANMAAEKAIAEAQKTGGGTQAAREVIQAAMTSSTGAQTPALQQALGIIERQSGIIDYATSSWEREGEQIAAGRKAKAFLASPGAATVPSEVREQMVQEEATGTALDTARQERMRTYQLQMHRQQEDFNTSRLRMNRNYELQMQYQAEDFAKQRKYMIADYHTSVRQAEEDFYIQRQRAQRDFDKQVKRQSEETAKNMMDPYQRIGPQIVTDIAVLQQSLLEQNKSVSDQLASVQKLSNMGLSKNAIDQLKLMDPNNNQQVQRLLADAQTDPAAIKKINDLISKRIKLGTQLNTSEYNKAFQNMKEDFATSMDDMGDDFEKNMKRGEDNFKRGLKRNGDAFATAQGRAAAAHNQALSDMDADNKKAITRAEEDLTGMAKEFTSTYTDVQKDFLKDLANLPSNLSPTTKAAIQKVLEDEAKAIEEANKKATTTAETQHGREKTAGLLGAPVGGIEGGEDMQGVDGPTAGRGNYSGNWQYYRGGGYHGGADIGVPNGTPVYSVISGKVKVSTTARNGSTQNPSGSYGKHVMISDGKHDFWYAHLSSHGVMVGETVTPGSYLGKSGNTGNTRPAGGGHHLHFEVRPAGAGHGSAKNPAPWLANGGIALQHTLAHIGESGKEAVVPLNDRGMKFLSDAMSKAARYWQSTSASGTRAQGYSAPVTNNLYSYDQRTQFMGEVHVESQDPEDMARKLAQRERRNRLARKAGSAA